MRVRDCGGEGIITRSKAAGEKNNAETDTPTTIFKCSFALLYHANHTHGALEAAELSKPL